jgi:hypothetical protein
VGRTLRLAFFFQELVNGTTTGVLYVLVRWASRWSTGCLQ